MKMLSLSPEELVLFKQRALEWAVSHETACYFDSNAYSDPYSAFDVMIAAGCKRHIKSNPKDAFPALEEFLSQKSWALGLLGYDLKNAIEELQSKNPDYLDFPDLFFFEPLHLIQIKGNCIQLLSTDNDRILDEILNFNAPAKESGRLSQIRNRFTFEEYCTTVEKIRDHILRGDIYEMNLCQEFYAEDTVIHPLHIFKSLNHISPTPFSSFVKLEGKYIISATPERFLCRRNNKLISQPIKGTTKRGATEQEDHELKEALRSNEKERAENVMIVDLVRNDLTKCSKKGSVKVEELSAIYSFKQVHQMISTIVSEAEESLSNAEIIKATFPMGSMTGAPKLSAMKLIETLERSKRGVFSGAVGYFTPDGDFDFNVIIRTLLYNERNKYMSFQVGSAITYASDAKSEFEECLVKAEAILKVLSSTPQF